MRNLKAEFEEFERQIIPADAPPIQRIEMRRAFYAGAAVILNHIKTTGAIDDSAASLEGYAKEIALFYAAMTHGKA